MPFCHLHLFLRSLPTSQEYSFSQNISIARNILRAEHIFAIIMAASNSTLHFN